MNTKKNVDLEERLKIYEALQTMPTLPELLFQQPVYVVSTEEEVLNSVIGDAQIVIVAGAFFGDEGKGKTVDAIARRPEFTMVARVNSGANAGHTVVVGDNKYVFHLVPSGIMVEGVTNYIGSECVMDPVDFMRNEINKLVEIGFNYKDKLYIDNVHLVTPYHKLMDLIRNLPKGFSADDLENLKLGNVSTLQGISPVYASKAKKQGLRLDDLFVDETKGDYEQRLRKIIEKDINDYYGMLNTSGVSEELLKQVAQNLNTEDVKRIPQYIIDFLEAKNKVQFIMDLYWNEVRENDFFPQRANVLHEINTKLEEEEKLLLEGPQSYFLSNKVQIHGGSATSADTTAAGIFAASGLNQNYKTLVINVHKAPGSSRVGAGSNPAGLVEQLFYSKQGIDTLKDSRVQVFANNDVFDEVQNQFWDSIGKNGILEPTIYTTSDGQKYTINEAMAIAQAMQYSECGATTKKPRVMSLFDAVAHAYVNKAQGPNLTISAVDRADTSNKFGIVEAYVYFHPQEKSVDGYHNLQVIRPGDALPNERVLKYCQPIIRVIDRKGDFPISAKSGWTKEQGLPEGVKKFVATIESLTGANVISIGNGPEAKDLIYLERNN